jgi:hypothetical protein
LRPLIQKEIKKLCDAKIIILVRYSSWVENLVPIRKKNGEIRRRFQELKQSIPQRELPITNYPLPKMDQMLQKVLGSERISMMDGFSGYNQVRIDPEDVLKTTLTTLLGNFAYIRMSFGLMNVEASFQRAMDYAFADIKDIFIVIYLDNLTIFSKKEANHSGHLRQVF